MTQRPAETTRPGPYYHDPVTCDQVAESRRVILAAAESAPPGKALVLGAGHCAEIPLAALAERFEQVTLNDTNAQFLAEGIELAGLSETARAKVGVQVGDLTGSSDAIVAQIREVLERASNPDEAIESMAAVCDHAKLTGIPLDDRYDLIVASCVLSQLHIDVISGTYEAFTARFPDQGDLLRQSLRWTSAMYDLARRMEKKFIDDLPARLTPNGYIYLSDSAQVCYVELTPEGKWKTEGTHRLLRTLNLGDYFDDRFALIARDRWNWVHSPPVQPGQVGRLYDVQALVLRTWRG